MHWCQPPVGYTTDIDLSVALYDERWQYLGTCSYYELQLKDVHNNVLATSAGDLRDAPHPDGATGGQPRLRALPRGRYGANGGGGAVELSSSSLAAPLANSRGSSMPVRLA